MVALPVLLLLGSLILCGHVEAQSSTLQLKEAALQWTGTCKEWDCDCTFTRQRGCCCAANDMYALEDTTIKKMEHLWYKVDALLVKVHTLTSGIKVSFMATMTMDIATLNPIEKIKCFGPFSSDVPIPYRNVSLNDGDGYNPSMGVFTAPYAGVYVFSVTVFSNATSRLYHMVQLTKNEEMIASVWENNREDLTDSASHSVVLELQKSDQVYMKLMGGRRLCVPLHFNIFTGYILYPYNDKPVGYDYYYYDY